MSGKQAKAKRREEKRQAEKRPENMKDIHLNLPKAPIDVLFLFQFLINFYTHLCHEADKVKEKDPKLSEAVQFIADCWYGHITKEGQAIQAIMQQAERSKIITPGVPQGGGGILVPTGVKFPKNN